jgi:O-antigen/teichoic acid export membrane protein
VRRKIAYQFLVSNVSLIANFVLTVVLARLLTPEDIGIFSMSAVLVAIAHVFRDFGVSSFLKQEREITPSILSGAIGLLVATSFGMAALLYLSSHFWAEFFDEPRVADVIKVLAIGFAFIPLGAVPQALLMREMDVRKSSWVTLFSTGVYFIVSITLALASYAHMTMAWANLINIIVTGAAYNLVLGKSTSWIPTTHHWKKIATFGTGNLFASIIKAIDNAIPDVVLGKLSNASNVGLYSRANSTVNMMSTLINPTIYFFAVPYLAKAHHQQGDISKDFLRGDSIIVCLLLPPLIGIAILAKPIVAFLYGAQWTSAAEAIPWLCLSAGVSTLFSVTAYAVTSKGKPYAIVPALLVTVLAKFISIWLLFDGTLAGFAKAIAIGQIAGLPLFVWVNWHYLGVQPVTWLLNVLRPAPIWLAVGLSVLAVRYLLPADIAPFIVLTLSSLLMVVVTTTGYLLSQLAIREELIVLYSKIFKE